MAYLSVVVPNNVSNGGSLPRIQVLLQGLKLERFDSSGNYVDTAFTNNPAWVLLDVLRRCGWSPSEIDLVSFAETAAHCEEQAQKTGKGTWPMDGSRPDRISLARSRPVSARKHCQYQGRNHTTDDGHGKLC